MEKHINIVAILHIIYSGFGLIIALLISTILSVIGNFSGEPEAELVLDIIANGIAVFFFIIALPGIIGGVGLMRRREWGRILILIISVLDLINFPFGTALGAYSIWALVQPEVVEQFKNGNTEEQTFES